MSDPQPRSRNSQPVDRLQLFSLFGKTDKVKKEKTLKSTKGKPKKRPQKRLKRKAHKKQQKKRK